MPAPKPRKNGKDGGGGIVAAVNRPQPKQQEKPLDNTKNEPEVSDKTVKTGNKSDKVEKTEKADKVEKLTKVEKVAEKTDKIEDKTEKTVVKNKPEAKKTEMIDKVEQPDMSDKTAKAEVEKEKTAKVEVEKEKAVKSEAKNEAEKEKTAPKSESPPRNKLPEHKSPSDKLNLSPGSADLIKPNPLISNLHSPASSPPPLASLATRSPQFKPSTSVAYNGIPIITPPLDAVSAPSVAGSAAPSMTEWRGLAGSPGNQILMGESPPTQPSSYEDSARINRAWTARSPVGSHPSSHGASPPPGNMRRPLSFGLGQPDRFSDVHHRRGSIHSQFGHNRSGSHSFAPPPPHQAQAHFYGAPDIDFGALSPQSGMKAGERGYFFGFDTLPGPSHGFASDATDAVLAGYEGGLEVYALSKRGLDLVGSLKGLRGGVHYAKILPWTPESDAAGLYPLVAAVVHGPVLPAPTDHDSETPMMPGSPRAESVFRDSRPGPLIDSYQTTVEVHSLQKNKALAVLLVAPKVAINTTVSLLSPLFKPPPPSGAFQIKADAGTIVVGSGTTGESWIYRQFSSDSDGGFQFACIGKLWATIQQQQTTPKGTKEEDVDRDAPQTPVHAHSPPAPVFAVNGRWIAYSPATPSLHITLRAHVPVAVFGKAPGLSTVTAPTLPSVTASLDLPLAESMVNRIVRETTQELISGAKWVGQQGMSAWNAYWNKPSPTNQLARSPPGAPSRHDGPQFPPTHGISEQAATAKEPGLVSIVDLDLMAISSSLHHLTTFAPPLGCSFLSFSPNGLALFTASAKGDVQTVWDLMRVQYTKTSALQAAATGTNTSTSTITTTGHGPCVRQVAQFSRMTVARIVDVGWVRPRGQRLAVVTERGTVHIMDMAPNAFSWPPPRRRKPAERAAATATAAAVTATDQSSSGGGGGGNAAVSMATTALGAAFGVAKPLISRQRRSSGPVSAVSGIAGTAIVDSANHGGRAIAATISNSLGKTGSAINQFRLSAENRVSLPSGGLPPCAPCVVWVTGRRSSVAAFLCVVGDGVVRMFAPKPARRGGSLQSSRRRRGGPKPGKYQDFRVQSLPNGTVSDLIKHLLDAGNLDEYLELDRDGADDDGNGANTLTLEARPRGDAANMSAEAAIPQAEIESSAPYQPFHTDRRVALLESQPVEPTLSEHMSGLSLGDTRPSKAAPWTFGRKIPAVRLELNHPPAQLAQFADDEHRALPSFAMERVMHMAPNDDEIVVTTRKRRHIQEDGDGFFEDDCEVLDFADQRV